MSKPRLTEAEFAELKRKRDEAIAATVSKLCKKHGWDENKALINTSPSQRECYCACPDGPCQHEWDGPEWTDAEEGSLTFTCSSKTCSRCGAVAMFHDMRFAP